MRDYAELVKALNEISDKTSCYYCHGESLDCKTAGCYISDAADAIEELLATVSSVVKCKECRWCHSGYCEKYDDLIPFGCANKPWEDWFCADGKRPEPPKEDAE